jgi:hypothetical protein
VCLHVASATLVFPSGLTAYLDDHTDLQGMVSRSREESFFDLDLSLYPNRRTLSRMLSQGSGPMYQTGTRPVVANSANCAWIVSIQSGK